MEKSKKFLLIVLTISLILLIGIPSTFATSVDNNTIISSNRDNGSISTNTIDNNSYYNQNSINGASEDVSNKIVEDNSGSNFFTKESINDNKSLISDNEGSIVYVNGTSGDDTNTGSSWNSSFKTLQYALTVVKNSNGTINTIYIAPGSYAEGKFNLTSNVTFTGFGDVYIDGLNKTDLFAIAANNVTAIFNNIKFINSNATTFNGGAISSKSYMTGKIVVNNCSFINNTGSMWVAAIYSSNNLIIENSTFINNVGGFGGAIYCSNETQVINSVFINNTAKGTGYGYNFGGAIRVQGGNVNVTKYIFFGNNASNGSAIELFNSLVKSATINYNIFENYPEGATVIGQSGVKTSINANYNYFGLNSNITKIVGENITADYWTILDLSFLEDEIAAGKDYDLVIDFTKYTDGTNYYTLTEKMPAVNLSLSSKLGSISPNIVNLEDGTSTVKYSALSSGDETITIKDPYHEGTFKFVVSENENNIIHVSVNGSDDTGDGSKDNPYQSIDKAIAMNDALGGNKTIFIFNGTYKSNSQNITKKVIIIGESAGSVIIDGELNDYILNISSDVIVRNIIFKNGKNAIVNNGTLTLNNCSFENNTNIGVYNINEALINGTNFTGNGIAIYSSGNLELYNGVLSNNLNGGMYVENNASIISSEFVNNTALNGGAIWGNNSNIVVNNSIFTSNTASISGGAIYLEDSAAGLNGNIINNCSSPVGNYIYLDNSIVNKLNIIFMDNKTAGFVYDEDTPVLTANVTDDMGNPIGGGFINFYANNESVANVSVVEGLAIYNYTNAKLGLYNISGNYSGVSNPVIKPGKLNVFIRYWYINDTGYATLQDAIANVNNGEVIKGLEGVYAYDSSVLIQTGTTVKDNVTQFTITSLNGGELIFDGSNNFNKTTLVIDNSVFNITLIGLTFINAFVEDDAGAIYNHGILNVTNCSFSNNTVIDPLSGDMIDYNRGAGIFNYGGKVTVTDSYFYNNTAPLGGAIFNGGNSGYFTIYNSTFVANNGTSYNDAGGAIYSSYSHIYVYDSLFENNTALRLNDYRYYAGSGGGTSAAIFLGNNLEATVDNCDFVGNKALYWAGAIKSTNNLANIFNCRFMNNTAQSGGALHGTFNIVNSTFINNTAVKGEGINSKTLRGGAIDLEGRGIILNSTFIGNTAIDGGAVFTGFNAVNISGCVFENNTGVNGGAINNYHNKMNLTNSIFNFNNGVNGGAVYHEISRYGSVYELNITNNTFNGNNATNGGAIYLNGSSYKYNSFKIISSVFTENTATNGSAIYGKSNFTANYNVFVDNYCLVDGTYTNSSVISYYGNASNNNVSIENNWWGNNAPVWDDILNNLTNPNDYLVFSLSYENITGLNNTKIIRGKLYWNNTDSQEDIDLVPIRFISLYSKSGNYFEGKFDENNGTMNNGDFETNLELLPGEYNVTGMVDNEIQTITISVDGMRDSYIIFEYPDNVGRDLTLVDVKLINGYGNPISNMNLSVVLNYPNGHEIAFTGFANETGEFIVQFSNLTNGEYGVTVNFAGDSLYLESTNSTEFTISPNYNSTTSIDVNGKNIIISLKDNENNPISNANLVYSINGTNLHMVTTDGNGIVNITGLYGNFNLTAIYAGNDTYSGSNSSKLIAISKTNAVIHASGMTQYAVDYYNGERGNYFNFTLKDSNGNALANKTVYINIAGKTYTRTTDSNGFARIQINLARASVYTVSIYFAGDNDYNGVLTTSKLTINKKPTTLTIAGTNSLKVNAYRTLTFTLKGVKTTNSKKYVNAAGKTLKVTVNGKTYTLKTDKNGKATLKVKFTKTGTYTIKTVFKGDITFAAKTTTAKITVKR